MRISRRGQREARHVRELVHQRAQQAIVGPEIVPPFGHAMRLVDREQRDFALREQIAEMPLARAFGRHIQKVELARAQALDGFGAVLVRAGQRCGADSVGARAAQLVVHQSDQRADDDAGALQ